MQLAALARGLGVHQWRPEPRELAEKRCTIVGLGDLGRSMAHLALAYGMDLSYISRQSKPELDAAGAVPGTRAELLPRAEIVILTGPTDTEMPVSYTHLDVYKRQLHILELTTPGNVVARWELDLLGHRLLRIGDVAADIPVSDVDINIGLSLIHI